MRFRGPIAKKEARISGARLAALRSGDVAGLIAINRAEIGLGPLFRMEDDDDDHNDDNGGSDDDTGGDDDGGGDDSGDGGSDTDDPKELARQLDSAERRMKAADKRAAAAEKKVKDAEDAEKGELQKAQDDLKELQSTVEEQGGVIHTLRLENAFLTANKHNWHDADTALSLAQSGGYLEDVADEDGVVDKKALGSALDKLAKDKKYLVKTESKDDSGDDDAGPSGEPAGGRSKNSKDKAARRKELGGRFASLNR